MNKILFPRLKRLIIAEHAYEFRHAPHPPYLDRPSPQNDLAFNILRDLTDTNEYVWEAGRDEAESVRRRLVAGEIVVVLHQDGIVYARAAIRTRGWFSLASRKSYRPLADEEYMIHFVRSAKFARGRGIQARLYKEILASSLGSEARSFVSSVNVKNIPSVKGSERSGGIRTKHLFSLGILGGRFGITLERPIN